MIKLHIIIIIILLTISVKSVFSQHCLNPHESNCKRSFVIDHENNCFRKDGQEFQYVSGTIHYFRVPHQYWRDRLQKLRYSGANAVQTYVEWSSHEPEPGNYSFHENNDVVKFIKIAQEEDLLVILRPGPYICAERDYGGFPYWLQGIDPNMKLRTTDPSYLEAVESWYSVLLPKIRPLLYSNGGPVITVQVENEYGSFGCDKTYTSILRDYTVKYLKDPVVLFTTDGYSEKNVKCGSIEGVHATVDFGTGVEVEEAFKNMRTVQPNGPLVNSEYYPGWLDHWNEQHNTVNSTLFCKKLDEMLAMNASVNIYVFHGGTNFGFTSGANADDKGGHYQADPTSYDYDAPLTEAGDPTEKFFDIRRVLSKYLPVPSVLSESIPKPVPSPKMAFGPIDMSCQVSDIFQLVNNFSAPVVVNIDPLPFEHEDISQPNGFLLYTTKVTHRPSDPASLKIPGLKDRAYVFVNQVFQGIMSREFSSLELPILVKQGDEIEILVENQGRIGFGSAINEVKGITGSVRLGSRLLINWHHYNIPLQDANVIQELSVEACKPISYSKGRPSFFRGSFHVPNGEPLADTFLSLQGWSKGFVWINGFNIGRYWPIAGPQVTLYVPKHLFKVGAQNDILVLELEDFPCLSRQDNSCSVEFVREHVIDAPVPEL